MMDNPCAFITDSTGKANCATYAGKAVSQVNPTEND